MHGKWRIGIYGDPDGGDDELLRVNEEIFDTQEAAKRRINYLETLSRYSEYDFVAEKWREPEFAREFQTIWWRPADASILDQFDPDPLHTDINVELSVRMYNTTFESILCCRSSGISVYQRSKQDNLIETDGDASDTERVRNKAEEIEQVMARISDSWIMKVNP